MNNFRRKFSSNTASTKGVLCPEKSIRSIKRSRFGNGNANGDRRESGSRLLSKGIRLCQTGDHEWSRQQGDPCRADTPRHDINVGAGNAADGFPRRENNRRLADEFVSADGERRQGGCQGRKARRRAQGTRDGYVLGRPLWNRCRSRGLHLDDRYPHCTTHTEGNATENEGTNRQPTGSPRCERLLSSLVQAPLSFFLIPNRSSQAGGGDRT